MSMFFLCNPPLASSFSCKPWQWMSHRELQAHVFRYQDDTYRAVKGPQSIICKQSVSCHTNPRLTTSTDPEGHLIPFSHLPHLDWGTENRTSHKCALLPHHIKALILNYKCCSTGSWLEQRCFYLCSSKHQKRSNATPFLSFRDFCSPGVPSHTAAILFFLSVAGRLTSV